MQKILLVFLLSIISVISADAQLGGLINKVKNKVNQRADRKVDNEIDKTLDKAEGKKTTTSSGGTSSGEGSNTTDGTAAAADNSLKSYSKFDFIPGDSILYADDFQQDELGELPLNWNTNGTGEVITIEKFPGKWMRLHKQFTYLSANQNSFGDNYTIEFDVILQLKNNGWMFPEFYVGVFSSKDESPTANDFLKNYEKNCALRADFHLGEYKSSRISVKSWMANKNYYSSESKGYGAIEEYYGRPVHVSIQVQKERYRMWINSDKVFDAPKAIPAGELMNQLFFEVSHTNYSDEQFGIYVGNIKVATGKPDTRHKLMEEGKFSTNGILFDFQSAVIKPESYGVVKEIAGVLKEFNSIKVKVVGHTSSDGDDKANMELSKKRSEAVKDLLVSEFGIDAARIESEGKGETEPMADNKTKEGKIMNRRVEFIKL